jgi:RNA exonuclease 4
MFRLGQHPSPYERFHSTCKSSTMELKDLSSNWKKLQPTLKQSSAIPNKRATDKRQENRHGLKHKRSEGSPPRSQYTQFPRAKRSKKTTGMGVSYSKQDAAVSIPASPTIRPIAQSRRASSAADRVNEGLAQTYGPNNYITLFTLY